MNIMLTTTTPSEATNAERATGLQRRSGA